MLNLRLVFIELIQSLQKKHFKNNASNVLAGMILFSTTVFLPV